MKPTKIILLLLSLMLSQTHATSIDKSGIISSDETWSADTVRVTNDVTVASQTTLTINPGVVVFFNEGLKIKIKGRILAMVTETDSIRFIGDDSWGWNGIEFNETDSSSDSSILSHCLIKYCKLGGNLENLLGGGIYINGFSKIRISHSLICSTDGSGTIKGGGIYCNNANPIIENNLILGNDIGGN